MLRKGEEGERKGALEMASLLVYIKRETQGKKSWKTRTEGQYHGFLDIPRQANLEASY